MNKNLLYVISITDINGEHDIQANSAWKSIPYDNYAVVPDDMVEGIMATKGYCDIEVIEEDIKKVENVFNEETGELKKIEKVIGTRKVVAKWKARAIPEIKEETPVSEAEQLRADIDYLAIMTGVEL